MVDVIRVEELRGQLDAVRVGVIDSRAMAHRVLTVLRVKPVTAGDILELDTVCRDMVASNFDLCLVENDIDIAKHAEDF